MTENSALYQHSYKPLYDTNLITVCTVVIVVVERKYDKRKDTFDMWTWWKENCTKLPAVIYVLCTVHTNRRLTQLLTTICVKVNT